MIILCQNKKQIVNLQNMNSLYIETEELDGDLRNKYFLKADIETKTYVLGMYYTSFNANKIYNEILDNFINHPETLLYKMPENDKIALDHRRKSNLVDLSKL